jgi:hypothetical protein
MLLSMNAWQMEMKFLPHTDITADDYEAVAKEWRYERLQQTLFMWHNGELPNNEDPRLSAFVEQLPQFENHCVRCFELRAKEVYKLGFISAQWMAYELLDAGENKCSECDKMVRHVYSY